MTKRVDVLEIIMNDLEQEYAGLRHIWLEFLELFARDSERIKLMNNVAPVFFSMVQNLMIEAIVILLSRVTDNVETGKKENLTLRRIPDALPEDKKDFADDLEALIDSARCQADQVRVWRNKRIAHLDYNHFMSEDRAVFKIGYTEMRKCIESIHDVLNRTSMIVWDTELSPEVLLSSGTAASLIEVLKGARHTA